MTPYCSLTIMNLGTPFSHESGYERKTLRTLQCTQVHTAGTHPHHPYTLCTHCTHTHTHTHTAHTHIVYTLHTRCTHAAHTRYATIVRPPPALEAASAALRAWLDPPPSATQCKALMLRYGAGGVNYAHQDQGCSPWQAVLRLNPAVYLLLTLASTHARTYMPTCSLTCSPVRTKYVWPHTCSFTQLGTHRGRHWRRPRSGYHARKP